MFAFAVPDNRRKDHQLAVFRHGKHLVNHLADGLRFQWLTMIRATRLACAGKHQAQIIVDFSDGADCRARVVGRGFLLDRDGRGQAFDVVYIGLFHH